MLSPVALAELRDLFPASQLFIDRASRLAHRIDAGVISGDPDAVLLSEGAGDIQRLLTWAGKNSVPVIARGAGTGLTGGAVAARGGVILGLARLNKIVEIDPFNRQVVVQPGVVTQMLQKRLVEHDLSYPPDPASQSTCTIGGNIAENAGGPRCLKYGVTANYVQGLEVVLANGQILWLGGKVLDLPEYDFASIITGSEGTLAVVTQAVLGVRHLPSSVKTLTAAFASTEAAGQAVSAVIAAGLLPATIELMDASMIQIVEDYLHIGLPCQADALLILDVDGEMEGLDSQLDEIVAVIERYRPLELQVARTAQQRELLWRGRYSAGAAISRISPNEYPLDVSVPRSRLAQAFEEINAVAASHGLKVTYLGHAGDGNLHPSLLCDFSKAGEQERAEQAAKDVLACCARLGGSIGAEHGIGIEKRDFLPLMYSQDEIAAMLDVKGVFDPDHLLNPGKIFPLGFSYDKAHLEIEPSSHAGVLSVFEFGIQSPSTGELPTTSMQEQVFSPRSPDEAAELLRSLQASGPPVSLAGSGTHWRGETSHTMRLETNGICGVSQLSTDDLYVTVRAGTTIGELATLLGEAGFRAALASPWPEGSLGGLISTHSNAPLRVRHGALRDQVLAVQVALADGRLLNFGRPLVKDVAGYAMKGLFSGAYGSLGLICELTLKIIPFARAQACLLVQGDHLSSLASSGLEALRRCTNCNGALLIPSKPGGEETSGYSLVLGLEGHPLDIKAELIKVKQIMERCGTFEIIDDLLEPTQMWQQLLRKSETLLRLGVPPGRLPQIVPLITSAIPDLDWNADLANGLVYITSHEREPDRIRALLAHLRELLQSVEGYAILMAGQRNCLQIIDPWGPPRPAQTLMRSLKLRWDRADILNRGEFI